MEFLRRRIGLLLRVLISGGILAWLARRIDWADLGAQVHAADFRWIALATVLIGVTMAIAALRWKILLRVQEVTPGFARVFQINMIGQFFNAFLLGTTGGDVVKILYITQTAPGKKSAAGLSVVFDRVIGLVALIGLTLLLTFWNHAPLNSTPEVRRALWTFYAIAAGVGAVLVLAAALPTLMRLANFKAVEQKFPFHEAIERLSQAFRRNARSPGPNLEALLLSLGAHLLSFLAQYFVARALHLDVSFLAVAAATALIFVLTSIPITIAGLGVRESLFILFLGLSGVDREGAVALSLIGFAISLFWSVVGGLIHLRYQKPQTPEAPQPGPAAEERAA